MVVVLLMLFATALALPLDYDPTDTRKSDDLASPNDPEDLILLKAAKLFKLFLLKG